MLAREPPFTGPSQQAVIEKMMSSDAPSVRVLRPGVSVALDDVLHRALARVSADRWSSASEFGAALHTAERATQQSTMTAQTAAPAVSPNAPTTASSPAPPARAKSRSRIAAVSLGTGFSIGVGLLLAYSARGRGASSLLSGAIRLAVLPYENAGDSADGYFADGMTDAVHDKLTSISGLEVIGSASSRQYRGTQKTPQEIGRELGVRYLVMGRIQWAKSATGSSRVRVNPELIDVESSADKWARPFDAPLTDVFQVQGDIASKVAQSLQVALTPAAKQTLAEMPTKDLGAYDSYLRGAAMTRSGNSPPEIRGAIAGYRDAIARDSNFALAWAAMGRAYSILYVNTVPTPAIADSADKATARALALRPDLPEASGARAVYLLTFKNDYAQGRSIANAALEHTQNVSLLSAAANVEEVLGQWDAATSYAAQAIKLDPRDPAAYGRAGEIALWRRDTAAARIFAEKGMALVPGSILYIHRLIMVDLQQGNLAGARARMLFPAAAADPAAAAAYVSNYYDVGWTLDSAHERLLLTLTPDAFDGDSASWAFIRAQQHYFRGVQPAMRAATAIAVRKFDSQLKTLPNDDQRLPLRGVALAYLGRYAEAIASAKQGVAIRSTETDAHADCLWIFSKQTWWLAQSAWRLSTSP